MGTAFKERGANQLAAWRFQFTETNVQPMTFNRGFCRTLRIGRSPGHAFGILHRHRLTTVAVDAQMVDGLVARHHGQAAGARGVELGRLAPDVGKYFLKYAFGFAAMRCGLMRRQTPNRRDEVLRYNCSNATLSPVAVARSGRPGSSWSCGLPAGMTGMLRPVALEVREVPNPIVIDVVPISLVIAQA